MRLWVQSLASLSRSRIWRCRELWCRLAPAALIRLLAWEPPYATGRALKSKKKGSSGASGGLQVAENSIPWAAQGCGCASSRAGVPQVALGHYCQTSDRKGQRRGVAASREIGPRSQRGTCLLPRLSLLPGQLELSMMGRVRLCSHLTPRLCTPSPLRRLGSSCPEIHPLPPPTHRSLPTRQCQALISPRSGALWQVLTRRLLNTSPLGE